ncbi:MAG: lysine--tRNA ligase [Candidatus Woesearchaeota archaeon]|jgi:lysyl-tRNA synthetase class 1|nr:lysine--tRNA ligase [Candidatus Woesearchaeota archaeon]
MKQTNENQEKELFWADQLAEKIINRKKFHYIDKKVPKFDVFTVKTSASLSGVLHIGRLSDTIRGESAYRALKDAKIKAKLIWVAEDMDPLRKVPKNVPKDFEKYIGMAVTDVPDPDGNYKSYADRFKSEYFEVLDEFVTTKMEKFSMREEYKKGKFNKYIKKILERAEEIREIQNKYRTNKLSKGFIPWKPICDNCGKIVTTKVKEISNGVVKYQCKDYEFETRTAKGCGHKGENDPLKGNGKLLWKSEWAAQWAHWKVIAEGAGKEYQVPNSAFWINAEIVERVLSFPMPEPIFYEHLMIDGEKMSASLGNVVYPKDWLEIGPAELLKFFYNKRLMKTRSFSWKDLSKLYDDYDTHMDVFLGKVELDNKKEEQHMKRLFEISCGKEINPAGITFSHATMVAQIGPTEEDMIRSMEKTGHYDKKMHNAIFERINKAKVWLEKYAPEDVKFIVQDTVPKDLKLSSKEKEALHLVVKALHEKKWNEKTLFEEFYNICKKVEVKNTDFFRAAYNVLLNKDRGPKLAPFILALGKEKVIELFEKV